MKQWTLWTEMLFKSAIFGLESYITQLIGIILFSFYSLPFTYSILTIWLYYVLLSLFPMILKGNLKIFIYLFLIGSFITSTYVYHSPIFPMVVLLLFILWRVTLIDTKTRLDFEDLFMRFIIYIGLTILYFFVHFFFSIEFNNQDIINSYIIVFGILFLGVIFFQIKNAPLNKKLLKAISIQVGIILTSISALLGIMFLLKPYFLDLLGFIKKGINLVIVYLSNISIDFFSELGFIKQNKTPVYHDPMAHPSRFIFNFDKRQYNDYNQFFVYLMYTLKGIAIIIILLIAFLMIKRLMAKRPPVRQEKEALISKEPIYTKKNRKKRFVSPNYYRKLYQQYLIWLVKNKKLNEEQMNSSNNILQQTATHYPSITDDMITLTETYQRVRYGKKEPSMPESDYKLLIKKLKNQLKTLKNFKDK